MSIWRENDELDSSLRFNLAITETAFTTKSKNDSYQFRRGHSFVDEMSFSIRLPTQLRIS